MAHEGEGDSLHRVVLRSRHQEVGVGEDRVLGLRETGRALDLLGLRAALDLLPEEIVHRVLLLTRRGKDVYPKDIVPIHLGKLRLRLGNQQFAVLPVENSDHTIPVLSFGGLRWRNTPRNPCQIVTNTLLNAYLRRSQSAKLGIFSQKREKKCSFDGTDPDFYALSNCFRPQNVAKSGFCT